MIEGVRIQALKLMPNDRGRLMEVQRADEADFPGFGQAYVTSTYPGVVKAWYRHRAQVDQIAIITGAIRLVLYDSRAPSPTHGEVAQIVLSEAAPLRVLIPPGIWHGFQASGEREAFLLHLNTVAWNPAQPDEERLPADSAAIPYRW